MDPATVRRQHPDGHATGPGDRSTPWNYRPDAGWAPEFDLVGYHVEATDGSVGKVDERHHATGASYLVVDTGPWIFGQKVDIPAGTVTHIDHTDRRVYLDRTKDQVNAPSPDFDPDRHGRRRAYLDKICASTTTAAYTRPPVGYARVVRAGRAGDGSVAVAARPPSASCSAAADRLAVPGRRHPALGRRTSARWPPARPSPTRTAGRGWTDVADWIADRATAGEPGVVACSALKRAYRDRLRAADPDLRIVYLPADRDTLVDRLAHRRGHFFPRTLLDAPAGRPGTAGPDEAPHHRPNWTVVGDRGGRRSGGWRSDRLGSSVMGERGVVFADVYNFRDLGGYHTGDGRTVAWRRLYRSDDLGPLRDDDQERSTRSASAPWSTCAGRTRSSRARPHPRDRRRAVPPRPPGRTRRGRSQRFADTTERDRVRRRAVPGDEHRGGRRHRRGAAPHRRPRRRAAGLPLHRRQGPHRHRLRADPVAARRRRRRRSPTTTRSARRPRSRPGRTGVACEPGAVRPGGTSPCRPARRCSTS